MQQNLGKINLIALVLIFCAVAPSFPGKIELFALTLTAWLIFGVLPTLLCPEKFFFRWSVYQYLVLGTWFGITGLVVWVAPLENQGAMYSGFIFSIIALINLRLNIMRMNVVEMKRTATASLILYCLIVIRALVIGGDNTNIYRLNKGSGVVNETVGNFGIYYAMIFIVPIGLFLLTRKGKKNKFFGVLCLFPCLLLMFRAQYTIAFIVALLIMGLWYSNQSSNKYKIFVFICASMGSLVLVLMPEILIRFLQYVIDQLPASTPIVERLENIQWAIAGDLDDSNLLIDRLDRYWDSIRNIAVHPILGRAGRVIFAEDNSFGKPGHNSLFEFLNVYGLPLGIAIYSIIIDTVKPIIQAWKTVDVKFYNLLLALLGGFIVLSCMNPIFNLFTLSWMMLNCVLFVPLIYYDQEKLQLFQNILEEKVSK